MKYRGVYINIGIITFGVILGSSFGSMLASSRGQKIIDSIDSKRKQITNKLYIK